MVYEGEHKVDAASCKRGVIFATSSTDIPCRKTVLRAPAPLPAADPQPCCGCEGVAMCQMHAQAHASLIMSIDHTACIHACWVEQWLRGLGQRTHEYTDCKHFEHRHGAKGRLAVAQSGVLGANEDLDAFRRVRCRCWRCSAPLGRMLHFAIVADASPHFRITAQCRTSPL